jgi:hypothetical protein
MVQEEGHRELDPFRAGLSAVTELDDSVRPRLLNVHAKLLVQARRAFAQIIRDQTEERTCTSGLNMTLEGRNERSKLWGDGDSAMRRSHG